MNNLKIVRIRGGLGNQMFQYAFYRNLKEKYKNVKLDISIFKKYKFYNGYELKRVFGINADIASKEEIKDLIKNNSNETYFKERRFSFDNKVFTLEGDIYYDGYWQSEKYFKDIESIIRKDYEFKNSLKYKSLDAAREIEKVNSVSLNIRRGDYVTNKEVAKIHGGICTKKYYYTAVQIIKELVSDPVFFIFSDDINWVKDNISIKGNKVIYVDWTTIKNCYLDMQLMSLCNHNIIANSSFSWWAAWLNTNNNKIIITPSKWFNDNTIDIKDLIPDTWYRI